MPRNLRSRNHRDEITVLHHKTKKKKRKANTYVTEQCDVACVCGNDEITENFASPHRRVALLSYEDQSQMK